VVEHQKPEILRSDSALSAEGPEQQAEHEGSVRILPEI